MKARSILACAFAGAAFTFGETAASAQDAFTGTISFASDSVEPGGSVDITATCGDTEVSTFRVNSPILAPAELRRSGDGTTLSARATVKPDATPEIWPVSFTCGAQQVQGYLRVTEEKVRASIRVEGRDIRPGQEVTVAATCDDPKFTSSKVISPVLTAPDLRPDPNVADPTALAVVGRINSDAKPGTHSLSFTCAGKKVSGRFTIAGKPAAAPARAGQVPVKPKGAAETGELAGQPVEDASNPTGLLVGGAGGLLAAAGAGVWLYRRRQRV
jgi:hypothetical protein